MNDLLKQELEVRVSSEDIAAAAGIQHKNAIALIRRYHSDFANLGPSAFQTRLPPQGGHPFEFAMLNEDQAMFLFTLFRNTPQAVEGKKAIIDRYKTLKKRLQFKEPARDAKWIEKRTEGKPINKSHRALLTEHGVRGFGHATAINAVNVEITGEKAHQLRQSRGIPNSKPVRDYMSKLELTAISLSEILADENIVENNAQGNTSCIDECRKAARHVRVAIDASRSKRIKK